ncbi:MAG TPA: hypothetical protein VII22_27130 [Streptosporangiaceae bacterium]|jgi:hypothetical protein
MNLNYGASQLFAVATLRRWLLSAWLAMPELILRFAALLQKAELALVVEGSHFDMRRRKVHRVFSRVEDPLPWRSALAAFRVHREWTG